MSLRTAAVIRHVSFEDLGVFERVLAQRGIAVRYVEAGVDHLEEPEIANADLLIVLGGPIGVYDEPSYPFLAAELRLIERRLRVGAPLLGVCLGAQLIAAAAAARVYPGPAKEVGFSPIALTPDGQLSCLSALSASRNMVLHWHGDTFDLPAGAVRLASTPVTQNQAFSIGANVLGLQFHMEADPRTLERWLIGHTVEIAQAKLDVADLRGRIAWHGTSVAAAGAAAFSLWLDRLNLSA
jgi:GMP synthase (glutamine-hydrolysing)